MAKTTDEHQLIVRLNDKTSSGMSRISSGLVGLAAKVGIATAAFAAFNKSIDLVKAGAKYEASLVSLEAVTQATGRNITDVYKAMETQIGGLADKAAVATGFLKGMTTTLDVQQINGLTTAVKNASLAMGEDFNVQLPLIIKAVKQLNPAILDNIGVTVRLDEVNKRIRDGYYGVNTAINEATQQHAIYTEIIKQTAIFQGQEAKYLKTTAGQFAALKIAITDLGLAVGQGLLDTMIGDTSVINEATAGIRGMIAYTAHFGRITESVGHLFTSVWQMFADTLSELGSKMDSFIVGFQNVVAGALSGTQEQIDLGKYLMTGYLTDVENTWKDSLTKIDLAAAQVAIDVGVALGDTAIAADKAYKKLNPIADQIMSPEAERQLGVLAQFFQGFAPDISGQTTEQWAAYFQGFDIAAQDATQYTDHFIRDVDEKFNEGAIVAQRAWDRLTSGIVDMMFDGRMRLIDVFKGIAQDFLKFTISEILKDVGRTLVPGIVKFLGGIFDTPSNDRMLVKEGRRAAMFFGQGYMSGLNTGNFAAGTAGAIAAPAMAGGASFGGGGSMVINFHGPVSDRQYAADTIAPIIAKASRYNQVDLATKQSMYTGGPTIER